ncbi:MAG: hypothetical protein PBV01_22380 [Brucella anthropi]
MLIVAGEEDRTIPAGVIEACADAMPSDRSAVISLPGVDHFVMSRLREGRADRLAGILDRMAAALLGEDQKFAAAAFATGRAEA